MPAFIPSCVSLLQGDLRRLLEMSVSSSCSGRWWVGAAAEGLGVSRQRLLDSPHAGRARRALPAGQSERRLGNVRGPRESQEQPERRHRAECPREAGPGCTQVPSGAPKVLFPHSTEGIAEACRLTESQSIMFMCLFLRKEALPHSTSHQPVWCQELGCVDKGLVLG